MCRHYRHHWRRCRSPRCIIIVVAFYAALFIIVDYCVTILFAVREHNIDDPQYIGQTT